MSMFKRWRKKTPQEGGHEELPFSHDAALAPGPDSPGLAAGAASFEDAAALPLSAVHHEEMDSQEVDLARARAAASPSDSARNDKEAGEPWWSADPVREGSDDRRFEPTGPSRSEDSQGQLVRPWPSPSPSRETSGPTAKACLDGGLDFEACGPTGSPARSILLKDGDWPSHQTLGKSFCLGLLAVLVVAGGGLALSGSPQVKAIEQPVMAIFAGSSTTTTTMTSSTSTFSTTTTSTMTTTTTKAPPTLLCYCVMMSYTYEEELVRSQCQSGVTIFACDMFAVFTDKPVVIRQDPLIEATVLDTSLHAKAGTLEHINNQYIFIEAWKRVLWGNLWQDYDWLVKVDPDAVFFPDRLRANLVGMIADPGIPIYYKTCKASFGLYGAVEVFSRNAMELYKGGFDRCINDLVVHGHTWKDMGEDMFMAECMSFLGVGSVDNFDLLQDGYCGPPPGDCGMPRVTFHPLKTADSWFRCHDGAMTAEAAGFPAAPGWTGYQADSGVSVV